MRTDRLRGRIGLRLRIAALAAVAVGVALAVGAVFLVGLLRSRLDDAATTAAHLRATDIAALARSDSLPKRLALPGEESAFVQIVGADGSVVASSENIEGEPRVSERRPSGEGPLVFTTTVRALSDHEHARLRIVALNTTIGDGSVVTVFAGEGLERTEETVSEISTVLLAGVPILVVLVGAVTWWAVGRTLRPVRRISKTMDEITASDLHRRVPKPTTNDEIGQLAHSVNETLSRLDASVDRQRRFVADASHELRGPLASLRADLEISVMHPNETSWPVVARDTLTDVERLEHLTEDLLLLARIDANPTRQHVRVNLAEITARAVAAIRRTDVTVTTLGLDQEVTVDGDRDQLHRMVRNLLHNAESHTRSQIDVAIRCHTGSVILAIGDDGPGVPRGDRTRVFERFVRLDEARTRDAGGTGLGLAIAHDVAELHHGTIRFEESARSGALLIVELPAHPSVGAT